jgi:hypothetical protein
VDHAQEEVVEEIWKLARLEMAIVVVRNRSHLPPPVIHEEKLGAVALSSMMRVVAVLFYHQRYHNPTPQVLLNIHPHPMLSTSNPSSCLTVIQMNLDVVHHQSQ